MPIEHWIHEAAKVMLGVSELPLDIRNYLDEIEDFATTMHGSIQSRQVLSHILTTYIDRKTLSERIKALEEEVQKLKGFDGEKDGCETK